MDQKKIINEAESLSKNSKIDNDSIKLLNNIKLKVEKGINETINNYIKKFRNIEIEENLTQEKYNKLKNLFKELSENTYKQNHLLKIMKKRIIMKKSQKKKIIMKNY